MNPLRIVLVGVLLVSVTCPAAASAPTPTPAEDDSNDDTIVDFSGLTSAVDDLVEELQGFTGSWDTTLEDLLITVLFLPFNVLAKHLIPQLAIALTNTPAVYPNPVVEDVHRDVLLVTFSVAGLAFPAAGILYMTGSLFGVSYQEVRMILPRLVAALIFSTVSLPLLQYSVDFADAIAYAFAPTQLISSITQVAGLSTALVIIWVVNAWLLLALVAVFVIRNVYILFIAAISPILALAWAFPKTKRYADTFISGYWTALAMAPLDLLALRFVFALLEGRGTGLQGVSNWILGVAGFALLLWVPYQLYGASQAILGQAYLFARGVKTRVRQRKQAKKREEFREKRLKQGREAARHDDNKFGYNNDDD